MSPQFQPMPLRRRSAFNHSDFIFEIKWDGFRALAVIESSQNHDRSRTPLEHAGRSDKEIESMTKICSKNPEHNVHRPKAKFCHTCGAQLEDQPDKKCECGHELTRSQTFCDMCGRKVALES